MASAKHEFTIALTQPTDVTFWIWLHVVATRRDVPDTDVKSLGGNNCACVKIEVQSATPCATQDHVNDEHLE